MTRNLQPDQRYALWSDVVGTYEAVFEPLTDRFAEVALTAVGIKPSQSCLDVAAGAGGAALMAARAGAEVTAIDAAEGMAVRVRARATDARLPVRSVVMDAQRLALAADIFDTAISVFGLILCSDAVAALRGTLRTMKTGGRIAVVTWTEPQNYELVGRLLAAVATVRGPVAPPLQPPAQLRFCDGGAFRDLLETGGIAVEEIRRIAADLEAPSARWLCERLAFAPGMAAMLAAQGEAREAVLARFVADLERDQGTGPVRLGAVALLGIGRKPETFAW